MQDKQGRTALMYAALYVNLQVVKLLIGLGVDHFIQDKEGRKASELAKHTLLSGVQKAGLSRAIEKGIIKVLKADEYRRKSKS